MPAAYSGTSTRRRTNSIPTFIPSTPFRLELPGNVAAGRVFADGPEEEGGAVAGGLRLGTDVVLGAFVGVVVQMRAFVLDDEFSGVLVHSNRP